MSAHFAAEVDHDEEGWWFGVCECGWQTPPCPGRGEADDFLADHRFERSVAAGGPVEGDTQ